MMDNILSSSDDEDFVNIIDRRPRILRRRPNYFEDLDEVDFQTRFRLSKDRVNAVLVEIRDQLEHATIRNNAISRMNQLLLTLRFYATGSHLISAGDFSGTSKTSAHRIIHRVTAAIARLRPNLVQFPMHPNEIRNALIQFFNIARFPRVVGCLDCTHIKIQSFGGDNAEYFRNRKGYFSINVQAICNAKLEFIDIVARWQGSVHDSTIFQNSRIHALFEAGTFRDAIILGDGGYALGNYLMTPLANPQTRAEQLYNESQIRTRNTIERVFGIWNRRFPILALGCRFQTIANTLPVIVATAVLHNIARRANEPLPRVDPDFNLSTPLDELLLQGDMPAGNHGRVHNRVQNAIVNEYFQSLL